MTNEKKEKEFVSVGDASLITGLSKQTIRTMVDSSQIIGYKTPSGQRRINKSSLQRLCNNGHDDENSQISKRKNFLYTRVSTKKQMDDLSRQVKYLQRPEFIDYIVIQDIGSGINFKRKGLQTILDSCIQGTIGEVIIAHRDRLCRFAFELIESIIQKAGGTLRGLDNDINISHEEELSKDLLSIIHIFNCRQMGKRSCKIKNQEKGNEQKSKTNSTNENINNQVVSN